MEGYVAVDVIAFSGVCTAGPGVLDFAEAVFLELVAVNETASL